MPVFTLYITFIWTKSAAVIDIYQTSRAAYTFFSFYTTEHMRVKGLLRGPAWWI